MNEFRTPGRAPDIDRLRAKHPLWTITAVWQGAASGPDRRRLSATREHVRVSAWTAPELSAGIAAEDAAHGWPSAPPG
jgi:hypothetical protein